MVSGSKKSQISWGSVVVWEELENGLKRDIKGIQ